MRFVIEHAWLIPLLPLLGAVISGFFGARWLKERSHWPIWLGVGASAALSFVLLVGMLRFHPPEPDMNVRRIMPATQFAEFLAKEGGHDSPVFNVKWYTWIAAGNFRADAGAFLDPLSAVMLCVITGVGLLICIYARGYMHGDPGYFRFFAYLGLFIFAMTTLVMANNFVLLYLGWEGVGLCSYLLIGFYYQRPAAKAAAMKAFIVNRIGDFGFALGIMLIFTVFGSVQYFAGGRGVLEQVAAGGLAPWQIQAVQIIPFLLLLGAVGKSAQVPLYVWLPDAMEGPTPVSALIHAATMVTAGVYMIVRCSALFMASPAALPTVAVIGTFTAIYAATIALRQFDLKKVFAYSTISQLGFMFAAAGLLTPVGAIFHLVTHAFFKALLFLTAGVVMHAMAGELDMRKMSGLRRYLPWTNGLMLVGCLALAGVPPFAGFFSKDQIIAGAFEYSPALGLVLLFTAFVTAYYTFRLYFRVFWGPEVIPAVPEGHHHHGPREPAVMIAPLVVLALGALLAGLLNWPERDTLSLQDFLEKSPSLQVVPKAPEVEGPAPAPISALMGISAMVSLAGIGLAYWLHVKDRPAGERFVQRHEGAARLLEAKYWVDEIYDAAIVQPLRSIAELLFTIDRLVVDGAVWMIGAVPKVAGLTLQVGAQRGSLQGYALMMLFGLLVIVLMFFLY